MLAVREYASSSAQACRGSGQPRLVYYPYSDLPSCQLELLPTRSLLRLASRKKLMAMSRTRSRPWVHHTVTQALAPRCRSKHGLVPEVMARLDERTKMSFMLHPHMLRRSCGCQYPRARTRGRSKLFSVSATFNRPGVGDGADRFKGWEKE